MFRGIFFFCSLAIAGLAVAQDAIRRDTSFTVHATYLKEKKKYPFIAIAQGNLSKSVKMQKDVVYSTSGNRSLHADVFYPVKKSKIKLPGVLLIHGGGWKSGDKLQMVPMACALAAMGYVAVAVEYRLSPEAPFPAALHDVKAAVRWMRSVAEIFNLDTTHIAALGVSAGGQLAALLGTTNGLQRFEGKGSHQQHGSAVQAIIDIDGILAFKHPESEEGVVAAEWLGGTYEQTPTTWAEASALTHAGKSTPPVLFINSANPRFHAGRDDMIEKLKKYHIYTEIHTLPNTPHTFWLFHPWFTPTVNFTLQFLEKVFQKGNTQNRIDNKQQF